MKTKIKIDTPNNGVKDKKDENNRTGEKTDEVVITIKDETNEVKNKEEKIDESKLEEKKQMENKKIEELQKQLDKVNLEKDKLSKDSETKVIEALENQKKVFEIDEYKKTLGTDLEMTDAQKQYFLNSLSSDLLEKEEIDKKFLEYKEAQSIKSKKEIIGNRPEISTQGTGDANITPNQKEILDGIANAFKIK